jgi:hypothetical protein
VNGTGAWATSALRAGGPLAVAPPPARIALPFTHFGNRQTVQQTLAVTPLGDTVSLLHNESGKVNSWKKQQHNGKRHTAKGVALQTAVMANGDQYLGQFHGASCPSATGMSLRRNDA